jgi:excinuclease ABC subunit C
MSDDVGKPSDLDRSTDTRPPKEKVKDFPDGPGVYLMKDAEGRVLYIGKAKNLRSRASSYFTNVGQKDPRIVEMTPLIADIDHLCTASEVDALLLENRLIKDIQPKFNVDLKDDKTFPYLQIVTCEDFPRVEVTRQPRDRGVKLYGPFTSAGSLRAAVQALQRAFKFRTCTLDIDADDPKWRYYRPCLLHSIHQCTAPCNFRISKEDYRRDLRRLMRVLDGNREEVVAELRAEMEEASKNLAFERAAELRNEISAMEKLDLRGDVESDAQPEAFFVDPSKGLAKLKKILGLSSLPRTIEGIDIAHLAGQETVASLVKFLDGVPFKPHYRRFRIKTVRGVDDYASIKEVILRRFRAEREDEWEPPDILLIDGGKGQLNAALEAFQALQTSPPTLLSLAKREEEIHLPGDAPPIRLRRHNAGLRVLQAVRDEAHRFARHYHHLLRSKKALDE